MMMMMHRVPLDVTGLMIDMLICPKCAPAPHPLAEKMSEGSVCCHPVGKNGGTFHPLLQRNGACIKQASKQTVLFQDIIAGLESDSDQQTEARSGNDSVSQKRI